MGYRSYTVTHQFSGVNQTINSYLQTAAALLDGSNQAEKIRGICLLDAVTTSLCKESWSPQNTEVLCSSDQWDTDAEMSFSNLVLEMGLQWLRLFCKSTKLGNSAKRK